MPTKIKSQTKFSAPMSWGALHVYAPGKPELDTLRAKIVQTYAQAGLRARPWNPDRPSSVLNEEDEIAPLVLNAAASLGADELLLIREATDGWVAILSCHWEWAPVGQHPLALALSADVPVFSVTCIEDRYAEYALYEGGRLAQMTLVGPEPPPVLPDTVPPLDLERFKDKGAVVEAPELTEAMAEPDRFLALLGPDEKGYRDTLEGAPLTDFSPQQVLIFR